jgi:hypothetical protein
LSLQLRQTPNLFVWKIHQFWFNFAGSALGWLALYALKQNLASCLPGNCLSQLTFLDVVIFVIAFVGITGHLPFTTVSLLKYLMDLLTTAAKKAMGS